MSNMDAAKAAINKFTSHKGHTTTVEETVNPAVTRETIKPVHHEEVVQAVDREVHQHHYHTTVQPLTHQERLPEKHTHNLLPTEQREYRHDNEGETSQRITAELGRFQNQTRTEEVRTTQSQAPTVTGEHVHHHVHETVVPVVQKETIQPEVVHTTVPIHETHVAAAEHHGLSALPMKTLDEFTKVGGVLTGGKHHAEEHYEGPPRAYNEKLSTTFEHLGLGHHGGATGSTSGVGREHNTTGTGGIGREHNTAGAGGVGRDYGTTGAGYDRGVGSGVTGDRHHHHGAGAGVATGAGLAGAGAVAGHRARSGSSSSSSSSDVSVGGTRSRRNKAGLGSRMTGGSSTGTRGTTGTMGSTGNTGNTGTTGTKKPSLMDRLNPKKDTDGDGKAGIME